MTKAAGPVLISLVLLKTESRRIKGSIITDETVTLINKHNIPIIVLIKNRFLRGNPPFIDEKYILEYRKTYK